MSRIGLWLVDRFSSMLAPEEREAVRGDLAERGTSFAHALWQILGLLARRQAELWCGWRPWTALVVLAVPFGILLGALVRNTANMSAIYLWLYADNWDPAFMWNSGFRADFIRDCGGVLLAWLTLACWSWICGFGLAGVSRMTTAVNGFVFLLALGASLGWMTPGAESSVGPNASVFSVGFYRWGLAPVMCAALVVLPALIGMRGGLRLALIGPWLRAVLWVGIAAGLATILLQTEPWFLIRSAFPLPRLAWRPRWWAGAEIRWMTLWPVLYWFAGLRRREQASR